MSSVICVTDIFVMNLNKQTTPGHGFSRFKSHIIQYLNLEIRKMCHKLYCRDKRPVAGAVVTCNVRRSPDNKGGPAYYNSGLTVFIFSIGTHFSCLSINSPTGFRHIPVFQAHTRLRRSLNVSMSHSIESYPSHSQNKNQPTRYLGIPPVEVIMYRPRPLQCSAATL